MRKLIIAALSVASLFGAPPAHAADLSYSGRYEHGVPDDWPGYDGSEIADAPEPEDTVPLGRRHHRGRDVEIVVEDTIVVPSIPAYGWPAYPAYMDPCACRAAGPSAAYAAGYAYGYALGTFLYNSPAGYGAYGWY